MEKLVAGKNARRRMRRKHKKEVATRLELDLEELGWVDGKLVLIQTGDEIGDFRVRRPADDPKKRKPKKSRSWKRMRQPGPRS